MGVGPLYSTRLPSVCMIARPTGLPLVLLAQRACPVAWSYHTRLPSAWRTSLQPLLIEESDSPGVRTWPGASSAPLPCAAMLSTVRKLAELVIDTLPVPPARTLFAVQFTALPSAR